MAEYRTLRMTFWNDPYIEELGPQGRLLYLYLITCPHTNNLGVLEVSIRRVAYETGLAPDEVTRLLAEAEQAGKLVTDGSVIWLVNFIRHQSSTSPRLVQSLRGLWDRLGSRKIRQAVERTYPRLFAGRQKDADMTDGTGPEEGMPTLSEGMAEGEGEGERERESKSARRFSPPSEEQVREYCRERGNGVSAEAFVNFYASKGWKVGSSPMRDWRAAVRTWEMKQRGSSEGQESAREARNREAVRRAVERFEGAALRCRRSGQ